MGYGSAATLYNKQTLYYDSCSKNHRANNNCNKGRILSNTLISSWWQSSLLMSCLLLAACGGDADSKSNKDTDLDGVVDRNDNCIYVANFDQKNLDGDRYGDACDNDRDGDGVFNVEDDFPDDVSEYLDIDDDGDGHNTDLDNDGDGINDDVDNCPYVANADQADSNGINDNDSGQKGGLGDACELTGLNDTGQDRSGALEGGNYSDCSANDLGGLQDCSIGRDYLERANLLTGSLAKIGAGASGFDFTKLDASGEPIVDQSTFYCVKDNVTGLTWESKKSGDSSTVNHKEDLFYWFDERSEWNAGVEGTKDAGTTGSERYPDTGRHCAGFDKVDESTWCNTQAFIKRMNSLNSGEGYCGFNDWRLPSVKELNSLVDYGTDGTAIDHTHFPWTQGREYWTSTNDARLSGEAWTINFSSGANYVEAKSRAWLVRLVRDDIGQEGAGE
jgi:hypothetical protein